MLEEAAKFLFSFCGKKEIPRIIQCAQLRAAHARARREAGDCRGVRAASLCGDFYAACVEKGMGLESCEGPAAARGARRVGVLGCPVGA